MSEVPLYLAVYSTTRINTTICDTTRKVGSFAYGVAALNRRVSRPSFGFPVDLTFCGGSSPKVSESWYI